MICLDTLDPFIPDRRSSLLSQYESFRKRSRDDSGSGSGMLRHSSLERQRVSGSFEKRCSWYTDDLSNLESFRPVTLTVSSFFKEVQPRPIIT